MIKGIDHIELIVRNVDEFVEMFQKLGFEVITRTAHHGHSAELKLPGENQPIFEIHQVSGEENIGMNHIALLVDELGKKYIDLNKKGIKFESDPHLVKTTGRTIVNFRDPDGWRLQLVDTKREKTE